MDIREGEIASIRKYISGNVVDAGCGSNKVYSPSIGIDQFPKGENVYGKPEWPSIAEFKCDISELPFKNDTIDTIISFHTIEHLERPKLAIAEWLRCLKKGGYLLIVVPDTEFTYGKDPTHLHEWKYDSFKRECLDPLDIVPVQANTLNNSWSFEVVIKK